MARHPHPSCSRGASLVLVLLLLGALSLGAAATLRMSVGTHQVAASFRHQAMAQQAAESALRFCEAQLLLPEGSRQPGFREAELVQSTAASPAWKEAARWSSGQLPALPAGLLGTSAASRVAPACLVEAQSLGSGRVHVVTARGSGPDGRGDAAAGGTRAGSAVWLQSVLLIDGEVRERVQRRLLLAPVR